MAKIIADTTSCLPVSIKEEFGIPVVPQLVHFGEKSYTEGLDINHLSFLDKLRQSKELPKTSAPPPEMFADLFKSHQNPAEPIFCIHPSADLSGTVRSAETAKLSFPELDIRVIDTRLVASPLGVVVHQAALWNQRGMSAEELQYKIIDFSKRGKIYFLVSTLDYLARGGRIGGASALVGNALQIKPILTLTDGKVESHSKERTFKKALAHLKSLVLNEYPTDQDAFLSIMHADNQILAEDLASFFMEGLRIPQPVISYLPPAIITHAGPGSIAVGFFS
jgi:DegV family protein with EDD domain